MKKLVLLFVLATVTLVSCNKDDENEAPIEGSWELSGYGYIIEGNEIITDNGWGAPGCPKYFFEIKSNRQLYRYNSFHDGQGCYTEVTQGTWERDGKTFTTNYSGNIGIGTILELNNSTLKLRYIDINTNYYIFNVYSRK
ncbi:MAG: hypothetical protein ACI924_000280 [Flavobacterium sp.]|jgi:hypothetical protein